MKQQAVARETLGHLPQESVEMFRLEVGSDGQASTRIHLALFVPSPFSSAM
ncbi:MAG TPA: hypothetical protein VF432_10190 [Thermoanaerobaculia bacterium]